MKSLVLFCEFEIFSFVLLDDSRDVYTDTDVAVMDVETNGILF